MRPEAGASERVKKVSHKHVKSRNAIRLNHAAIAKMPIGGAAGSPSFLGSSLGTSEEGFQHVAHQFKTLSTADSDSSHLAVCDNPCCCVRDWVSCPLLFQANGRRIEAIRTVADAARHSAAVWRQPETVSTTPSGWMYLLQRFPFLGYTALLLAMAGAYGWLIDAACMRRLRLMVIERIVLIFGLGLACLSLVILGCGVIGWMTPLVIAAPAIVCAIIAGVISWQSRGAAATSGNDGSQIPANNCSPWLRWGCLFVIVPFALYLVDGSLSPPTDFDVREYHLQGPKEWFQKGEITFLRHNVYTSFPFLTEMLSLGGMIVCNDWWQGALVGQCVLACFQLLSTLAVFAVGRRWMNESVAWLAALLYLTTPWTLRISLIAYAEGALTFYVIASAMMLLICSTDLNVYDRWRS